MKICFIKNEKECKYTDAKKLKVNCFFCEKHVYVKLNQKSWNCQSCSQIFDPFGIIYKATRKKDNKTYIGQTKTPLKERIRGHLSERKERTYFGMALKYYGIDAFEWEIIDYVENDNNLHKNDLDQTLNDKESKWIRHFNTFVGWDKANGYNLTTGGGSFSMAESSVARRSAENHGLAKLNNEEVKSIKLLLRDTGMYLKEISAIMRVSLTNINDIGRSKIWKSIIITDNDSLSEEFQEYVGLFPKERNNFLVYDVSTLSLVGEFSNQRECAKLLGVDYRNLNCVLKGGKHKKTAGGYTFIPKDRFNDKWLKETLPALKSNIGKRFSVYNYKTEEYVKDYVNQNQCARELYLNHIAINECLWKKQSFHKDYIFIFEEDFSEEWLKELIKKAKKNKKKSNK
ncbi:hypothetical protein COC64_23995 [Bacillus cereus]|uniref:GIY-YIG nuclease family protein n=1 Tax=Bacillus cereus TaxID=1396 RepID=UPI000BFCCACD|nr:GIY-YIG nuclease family protein [Bacillus cereus]PGR32557.1 hypothetical protein COC64_23995 [Bacillus cereus]